MDYLIYGEKLRAKNGNQPIDPNFPILSTPFVIATQVTREAIARITRDEGKYLKVTMDDGSVHHIGTHFLTTNHFLLACYNHHANHQAMDTTTQRPDLLRCEINLLDVKSMEITDTPYPQLQ